ncbi:TIGR04211 family SH3 domain-containing protein [Thalassotalea ganghwensis]
MKILKSLLVGLLVAGSTFVSAEQASEDLATGYISDDLFVYMHAGPGNNYRILGSINAGEEIKLTGKEENDYTQIIDPKSREAWVENRYINNKPGLRTELAALTEQLNNSNANNEDLVRQLNQANGEIDRLNQESKLLEGKIEVANQELAATKLQIKNQDTDLKKEWFFNGAIVLGIGLLVGLILPHLTGRKKSSMDSWR